ncbi:hypothetical protein ACFQ36_05515 [Arthrobacter sp. GCM10027362]|uniref:hypothetical protein n=1 Tax=Arthrobacter sp. GCM10027362 TaxID=3273379 RepID=UPI00362EADC4
MKNLRYILLLAAAAMPLAMTGCAGSAPAAAEDIDKNKATAECGMMARLLTEVTPSADNYEDLKSILTDLSTDAYDPVKKPGSRHHARIRWKRPCRQ